MQENGNRGQESENESSKSAETALGVKGSADRAGRAAGPGAVKAGKGAGEAGVSFHSQRNGLLRKGW